MRGYTAVFSIRFKQILQYRAAAVASLTTQFFFGMIIVMAYRAFYRAAGPDVPMTLLETTTYVWLGQALFRLLPWIWDREAHELIRSGNVAYELVRPLDLYWNWFSRSLALRSAPLVLQSTPVILFAYFFFGFQAPAGAASATAFAVAIVVALFLSAAITTLVSVTMMWTVSGDGIARLNLAVVGLLSGILIPLPFFPDWMQPLVKALPYRGLFDVPFRLYLGHIAPGEALGQIAGQVAWTVAIIIIGKILMARAHSRLVVQGG